MSTSRQSPSLKKALSALPAPFRSRLIEAHRGLKSALAAGDYDSCGLRVGRFAEILLRYLQSALTNTYIPFGQKIPSFADECRKLEQVPKSIGHESFRLLIPRALDYVYSLRNKRGIGHVGGDVDANAIDAATCARVADWCLSELLRIVHTLSLEQAQELVDALSVKQLPYIWEVMGKRRVLDKGLDYSSQTLLLLYSGSEGAIPAEDLCEWIEHPRLATYRYDILAKLHAARMIEYDKDTQMVAISPIGIAEVEKKILPKLKQSSA
jgi:hypothetical protein